MAAPLLVVEVLVSASREWWLAGKRCQPAMRGGRSGGSESEVVLLPCPRPRGQRGMLPLAWALALSPVLFARSVAWAVLVIVPWRRWSWSADESLARLGW
jgi:hypothetical protein